MEVQKLIQDLAEAPSVGLTADHWTSLDGDHYITVTVHFVKDWTLRSKVLETKAVYDSQTGEAIAAEIDECLTKFAIPLEKVVGLTVDNAANMAVAGRELNVLRIPCFAHSMNVSAGKLYQETSFTKWVARIRVHMAGVVLKEKLKALELPQHAVILDARTRWNSLYLMVQRFTEIYIGLSAASGDPRLKKRAEKEKIERVTDDDLRKGEEFVECMKILYTSTLAISTDKIPTISQILPTWNKLKKTFEIKENDSAFVKMVKATLWKDMGGRYQDERLQQFLEEATALDPRFKAKMLANEDVWDRLIVKVVDLLRLLAPPAPPVSSKPDPDAPEPAPETELAHDDEPAADEAIPNSDDGSKSNDQPKLNRKRSALEELFDDDDDAVIITNHIRPPSLEAQARLEVDHFRNFPGQTFDADPLEFYKVHHGKFPMISVLATRYFCVPGSSIPSESHERLSIDPDEADMLIFLHKNAD